MFDRNRATQCTCGNTGSCGYCPAIAVTATQEGRMSKGRTGDWSGEAAGAKAASRLAARSSR
jgi:hypothetical protein